MKLKVKSSGWSAGRPIAIINSKTAVRLTANVNDRLLIKHNSKKVIEVIDISSKISSEEEIVLSTEVLSYLGIKGGEIIDASLAKKPRTVQLINKKLGCKVLSESEISQIIKSVVDNSLTEIEIAFFISAIYKCGMNSNEIVSMTRSIFETGKRLKFPGKIVVDKHSIGGIAGNRTTPIVVSICASAGLTFPKTSSRAITSAAGTADVIESICRVNFSSQEIKKIINKTNACMVWGGALGFAPADDKIIRVESMINIDPEPNLLASIIAKKLSVGSKYILIDIPYGKFAKVDKKQGKDLKEKFEMLGKRFNIKLKCVLTDGSQPIGNGIGPLLEIKDILSVLENKPDCPKDLKNKSVFLAGQIFELCNKAKKGQGEKLALKILKSGQAFKKFSQIIKAQEGKGNLNNIPLAKFQYDIIAKKSGKVDFIDNKKINLLARVAGSPLDKKAGVYLYKHLKNKISKGDKLITIYSQSKTKLGDAVSFYNENKVIAVG